VRRNRHVMAGLDETDVRILEELVENARIPIKLLASRIGLSSPSTAERVRRLEEASVIEGYSANRPLRLSVVPPRSAQQPPEFPPR